MYYALDYITAKNTALKRFTDLTTHDLYVLNMLRKENRPVHYSRLYDLLHTNGYSIHPKVFGEILKRCMDNKNITRTQVAGNVLYAITQDGKRLLYNFSMECDAKVKADILKYGNGFPDL